MDVSERRRPRHHGHLRGDGTLPVYPHPRGFAQSPGSRPRPRPCPRPRPRPRGCYTNPLGCNPGCASRRYRGFTAAATQAGDGGIHTSHHAYAAFIRLLNSPSE